MAGWMDPEEGEAKKECHQCLRGTHPTVNYLAGTDCQRPTVNWQNSP